MRPPVFFLTERYFADTTAKMSPYRTLTPRYTHCSRRTDLLLWVPKRVTRYDDDMLPHSDPRNRTQRERVGMITTSTAAAKTKL
jgi:hypothetical protein